MRQCYAKIQYRPNNEPEDMTWVDLAYFVYHMDAAIALEAFRSEPAFRFCEFRVLELHHNGE
jgi:hypothetical protein